MPTHFKISFPQFSPLNFQNEVIFWLLTLLRSCVTVRVDVTGGGHTLACAVHFKLKVIDPGSRDCSLSSLSLDLFILYGILCDVFYPLLFRTLLLRLLLLSCFFITLLTASYLLFSSTCLIFPADFLTDQLDNIVLLAAWHENRKSHLA